jgi:glycine cleavage system aminomethyltransferase T
MVHIDYADIGSQLTINMDGISANATVVEKPFYDPKKQITKA